MRILSIDAENFLSIEKAFLEFDESGSLLIKGWNYDVDRANGAGKTAVLNALSFALYDKLPRKITATEILRRGTKKGCVTARVDCGSEILVVKRSRPKGVEFYKESDGTLEALQITQQEWESKLGLTYNQFIVSMYCSQANSAATPRFLLLNDTDKKEFLLQLLNLQEFALCKKQVDENIQLILQKVSSAHNQIAVLQSKIDAYSETLIDEDETKLDIANKEESKKTFLKALDEVNSVPKPDFAKYLQLEEDILAKKTAFAKARANRDALFAQWSKLGRNIKPFNKSDACPTCGTQLDNSHAKSVHEDEVAKLKSEQASIKAQIDALDATLLNENKIEELSQKLRERKRKDSVEYEKANATRLELTSQLNFIESQIKILNKKLIDNATQAERVTTLKLQKQQLSDDVKILSKDLEIQKTVSMIYSPTGAQAYVLDSAVSLFNEKIAMYVGELWPNLTYELQSYKENVKGEVTAKFSESIVMDGKPISLGSLSGGELKALSICADMALLGILEQQFGIHMSPIIFDEAFDGLDVSGKEFALDLIKILSKDRLVVVIDHASEMASAFDKAWLVEKRNGISTISVNA